MGLCAAVRSPGVQIGTGIVLNDFYALQAAFGAALDFFVGGGVMVHTGLDEFQYNGPVYYVRLSGTRKPSRMPAL
jgi:hypothetical protein